MVLAVEKGEQGFSMGSTFAKNRSSRATAALLNGRWEGDLYVAK